MNEAEFMMKIDKVDNKIFHELPEQMNSSFPMFCNSCGRLFVTAEQFISETQDLPLAKSSQEDCDEGRLCPVELFRGCTCGSTLID